jgi:uncharacterized membrane protein HdeD (DUF308 family)
MARYEDNGPQAPKGARLAFGILMICVYIGVGLLFIFNVFNIDSHALSCVIGGLLCAYGVWRGVRLYKGWG